MLEQIAKYTHMPKPLTVFGILFIIYAVFVLVKVIRDGYFSGIFVGIIEQIRYHYKILLLFILLILLSIRFIDLPVAKLCTSWYNVNVYTILDFFSSMGESQFVIGVLFTISIIYHFLGKSNHGVILTVSYVAAAYAGLFNAVLKFIFNRQRPAIGLDPYHFFRFFTAGDSRLIDLTYAYNSMPSGHTITVFAAVVPLILYTKSSFTRFLLVCFAVLVAISRIYTMNHWFSDICVSMVLGLIIGRAIYRTNKNRIKSDAV